MNRNGTFFQQEDLEFRLDRSRSKPLICKVSRFIITSSFTTLRFFSFVACLAKQILQTKSKNISTFRIERRKEEWESPVDDALVDCAGFDAGLVRGIVDRWRCMYHTDCRGCSSLRFLKISFFCCLQTIYFLFYCDQLLYIVYFSIDLHHRMSLTFQSSKGKNFFSRTSEKLEEFLRNLLAWFPCN